jgi:HAD superfamily hydrolase (TIGR01450 family)
MTLNPLLARYDQLILDLDGCVWVGEEPTPGAPEAIAALREAGKGVCFVTNESRHSGEDFVAKLWRMGVHASLADVVPVGGAMQHLLAETRSGRSAFVIGSPPLKRHVSDAGLKVMNGTDLASRADVVVVGLSFDLGYEELKIATLALRRGADFLATANDPTYPNPEGHWPGTGAIVRALEAASDRQAVIVGKPEPQLLITALDRLGERPTLVVGDRIDSDLAAAGKAHLDGALVLTGGLTREEAEAARDPRPVAVADTLAQLVNGHGP